MEKDLAKNFKVIAVDWANNVISVDKKKHSLDKADKEALLDYILTGRWFRHYKVGYDYYKPESWLPEEVFFSQEIDTEYPQDCEYVGRLTKSTLSQALVSFGHLMTTKEQEKVGDYFGQSKNLKSGTNTSLTASDRPSSIVKRSRSQSTEAPRRRNCLVIVPPDSFFHSQILSINASRPNSFRVGPFFSANLRSTTI